MNHPPDPIPQPAVRLEMDVIERCVNALTEIENNPDTLARVMRYLNSRFRASANRTTVL